MKRWVRVAGMIGVICFLTGNVYADWIDTFSGGQFDLSTWQLRAYPQVPGVTQFNGSIVGDPNGNTYLSLDEALSYSVGGAAFGMAFGSEEDFAEVRLGAVVNVTGDASHNYHGLGARASYIMSDGSQTPAPGMVANAYILHINWENGPANLRIEIQKVFSNNYSDVHNRDFETLVPGLDNARSFYAALDVIGSNPTYVTGYIYRSQGGELLAQTETLIDTDAQDSWEDPGPHIVVYRQGKSGIFGQNEQEDPPGFHTTFDDVSSKSQGAAALSVHPVSGAGDVSVHPRLSWMEPDFAQGRQLWFGSKGNMTPVDPSPATAAFDPGLLLPDTTYQWRVDLVGSAGPVTGNTWEFTTGQCLLIDTFESYADNAAIAAAWPHNILPNPDTGATYDYVFVDTDKRIQGDKGMRFEFQNQYSPFLTEATRTFDAPQDWTVVPNPCLTLDFCGAEDNVEQLIYVTLEDSAGNLATVEHPYTYAVQSETWRHWIPIDLAEFAGVDLGAIKAITLGVGDGADSGQSPEDRDQIYIDNIRICPTSGGYGR
ncbi:MAG: hypothetical protein K9N55_20015 [Phycisphaerae bacterium]|nr:hypothetical protein [Phycisphaerae bacterium]